MKFNMETFKGCYGFCIGNGGFLEVNSLEAYHKQYLY